MIPPQAPESTIATTHSQKDVEYSFSDFVLGDFIDVEDLRALGAKKVAEILGKNLFYDTLKYDKKNLEIELAYVLDGRKVVNGTSLELVSICVRAFDLIMNGEFNVIPYEDYNAILLGTTTLGEYNSSIRNTPKEPSDYFKNGMVHLDELRKLGDEALIKLLVGNGWYGLHMDIEDLRARITTWSEIDPQSHQPIDVFLRTYHLIMGTNIETLPREKYFSVLYPTIPKQTYTH